MQNPFRHDSINKSTLATRTAESLLGLHAKQVCLNGEFGRGYIYREGMIRDKPVIGWEVWGGSKAILYRILSFSSFYLIVCIFGIGGDIGNIREENFYADIRNNLCIIYIIKIIIYLNTRIRYPMRAGLSGRVEEYPRQQDYYKYDI